MENSLLDRRRFGAYCAALGLTSAAAWAQQAARSVAFPDGASVPPLGQGCWHLGQGRHPLDVEQTALRTGISLGLTLIDTSGNYGGGRSEEFVGHAIAGQRERVFLVSKVEGNEISGDGIARACAASLARLGTAYLDLYLLHWPVPAAEFAGVVRNFERLRTAGRIRAWGVSNFSVDQMEELFRVPDGHRCATNQVPYSLNDRRIERSVLPWCREHGLPVMAYSPLGGDHHLVVAEDSLAGIAAAHGCSPAAVALAWVMRSGNVIAIPESGTPAHVREDAVALSLRLTEQDLSALDGAFS